MSSGLSQPGILAPLPRVGRQACLALAPWTSTGGRRTVGRAILKWMTQLVSRVVRDSVVGAFRYGRGPQGHGLALTGCEVGTDNPHDKAATWAAALRGTGPGLRHDAALDPRDLAH